MSLLIACTSPSPRHASADDPATRALASARMQGFERFEEFEWAGDTGSGWAKWFPTPNTSRGSGAFLLQGARFAAYVGTVGWRGLTRNALLEQLLARYEHPRDMPLDEFSGSFAMIFAGREGIWLFTDALGIQKVYETSSGTLISTSFLVCRATLDRPNVNRLRAQEYVLLGAAHGLDTPIEGIRLVAPTSALDLATRRSAPLHAPARLRKPCSFREPGEAVEALSAFIADDLEQMATGFGSDIGMALSGGFDSRLLLAALDRIGIRPTLYVYGSPGDSDVAIASTTAARLGMEIKCIDKKTIDARMPAVTEESLASSIAFFDGLPVDGAIDRGSDRSTRLEQVQNGRLNLNGGGGEILRNFFLLGDRRFTADELVSAFYSSWPADAIRSEAEQRSFREALRNGILGSLGYAPDESTGPARRLERCDTELVYSLFRLRYWMGRNNSLAARYGSFLTPLAHPRLVALSASIPMAWKNFGKLEAGIIQALSPRVAAGPSGYGFEFGTGPNTAYRLAVLSTLLRPVPLRRRSAQIRSMLGLTRSFTPAPEWRSAVAALPEQDWIVSEALCDSAQVNRLLTLRAVLSDKVCGPRTGPP